MLSELLPRVRVDEYVESEEYKGNNGSHEFKEALKVMSFYSQKHLERAERGLKKSYYPDYVLSQMTLDDDISNLK